MQPLEREPFQLIDERDASRVVRGRITRHRGAERLPTVLVLHGFKGFMDWGFFPLLADRLADRGLAVVAYNVSGSGVGADLESFSEVAAFESNTYTRELEDAERVRDFLSRASRRELDLSRLGIFGHSRGGAIALLHAARRGDYRAVATWAALSSFDRWDDETKATWKRDGWIPIVNARTGAQFRLRRDVLDDFERHREAFDISNACRSLTAKALLVHGDGDEAVDVSALDELARAVPSPEILRVPRAGHTFGATHPLRATTPELERVLAATIEFFVKHLESSSDSDATPQSQ